MYLPNEKIKIIFIDIMSIPHYFDTLWGTFSDTNDLVFLFSSNDIDRKSNLRNFGEVIDFNGFNNFFSNVFNNNLIVKILNDHSVNSNQAAIITSDVNNIRKIMDFNITCIHLADKFYNYELAPDFICKDISGVKDVIEGKNGGYYAEAMVNERRGYQYACVLNNKYSCGENIVDVWAAGRYFPAWTAQGHYHLLSIKIISNKREGREHNLFYLIFLRMIAAYNFERSNVVICAIPPKPGQNNRFTNIINKISQNLNIENGLNYLYCNKDYGNNKIRGAKDREISLAGVFSLSKDSNFKGRNVVIIDDVLASGATLKEAAKVLYEAGAATVTAFVIGINQLTSEWRNVRYIPLRCPQCGGELNLRINNRNLMPFYGCENYPKCRYTMDYDDGYKKIKEQNIMRAIDTGEGVEF